MRHAASIALAALLALGACEQPDEALPPEGEIEGALSGEDEPGMADEPEIETIGEPEFGTTPGSTVESSTMEGGRSDPAITEPPEGSKLQKADPDY